MKRLSGFYLFFYLSKYWVYTNFYILLVPWEIVEGGKISMKKEIIGILICMLLIFVAVAPVINAFTNEINEVEEPPQPGEWPPDDEIIHNGFGRISNPERHLGGCSYCWSFNCIYVRCVLVDEYGGRYNRLFENGEVRYIEGDPIIITKHFMIDPLIPRLHFYLIVK